MPRRLRNYSNLYTIFDKVINYLVELYNNLYRRANTRREYNNLVQNSRSFIKFYLDYIQIEIILKKIERDFLEEFSKKIRLALKTILSYF